MDEIDRNQKFNERQLEATMTRSRTAIRDRPSLHFCRLCGKAIPQKRRHLVQGVSLCIGCQVDTEHQSRRR